MKEKPGHKKNSDKVFIIKLLVMVVIIVVVPLIAFRLMTTKLVDKVTGTISLQHSKELNTQMSEKIYNCLDDFYGDVNNAFYALKLIDNLDEEKLETFVTAIKASNNMSYLAFADSEGYIYDGESSYMGTLRISILGDLLGGASRCISGNETIGSESYILLGVSFDEEIVIDGKSISIAIMGMSNSDLADSVMLSSEYSGGYSGIINRDGSYVIKNQAEPYPGLNIFSILKKSYGIDEDEVAALKKAVSRGESYIIHSQGTEDRESVYMYFSPLEDMDWYTVNTLPSSFIEEGITDITAATQKAIILLLVIFLAIGIVIAVQSHNLRKSHVELQAALKTAEEASGAKTAFLFNMSHDIRTPMNAILGYTDIGLRHADDLQVSKDSYRKIKTASEHLLDLINNILEMSRIESGKMVLDEKPVDILQAIDNVCTMSRSLADAKSIEFDVVVEDLPNRYVYTDELHINEVIINIISNAVKYTPQGGHVKYRVCQTGQPEKGTASFRFEVSDDGIGMSQEFQKKLFEPFSREANSTISKTEGTGLGLSIVKKIVDMAGGTIQVSSVQHQGSTFIVEIPFRIMDDAAIEEFTRGQQEESEFVKTVNFDGNRVLLVEDNEFNIEIARYILEEAGLVVEEARDGSEAVKAVEEKGTGYYDFILMDIQMPVMNGYEATRAIRALPGGDAVPIIALSANAFEEDRKKSIEEGMNAHVAKPIDIGELLETMKSLS